MIRSTRLGTLFVAALTMGVTVLCASWASADDGQPEAKAKPAKHIVIKLRKTADGHAAAPASSAAGDPMGVLRHWFEGRVGQKAHLGQDLGSGLRAWFEGGDDVPLAGLRDAFKSRGWNAPKLQAWLQREVAGALPGLLQAFAARSAMGGGGLPGPGMQRPAGPMGWGSGVARGGHAQGPCPLCGHAPGRTARRGPFGPRGRFGMRRRGFRGPGFRGSGFGRQAFRGQAFRGQGLRGQGFPGRGFGAQGFPGRDFGPQGFGTAGGTFPGQVHTQQRAYVLWNDGSGWQRRELPAGAGFQGHRQAPGAHGFGPMGPGATSFGVEVEQAGPWLKLLEAWRRGHGAPDAAPAPGTPPQGSINGHPLDLGQLRKLLQGLRGAQAPHAKQGGIHGHQLDLDQLRKLLQGFRGAQAPQAKQGAQPGAAGGGHAGGGSGAGGDRLQDVMKMIEALRKSGANVSVQGLPIRDGTSKSKRIVIKRKAAAPKKLEKVEGDK